MADRDLLALWARVESTLQSVLRSVTLGAEVRGQIEASISHNELGLAFDDLVAALNQADTPPDPQVVDALRTAASDMALENNRDLRDLVKQVRTD